MTNTKTNEPQIGLGFVFISLIFFIRAGYYFFVFLDQQKHYPGEMQQQSFAALFLLMSFFYLASALGLLFLQRFGYYLAWLIILPDVLLSGFYFTYPEYAITGIAITILTMAILINNRNNLKPRNKTDKKAAIVIGLVFLAYLISTAWALQQPKPEQYQSIVTAEAIQKNDIKICDKLSSGGRLDCIRNYAESKNDPNLCKIFNESVYDNDLCYLHIAISIDNIDLCEEIKQDFEFDTCYLSFAKKTGNKELCNQMKTEYYKKFCIDSLQ